MKWTKKGFEEFRKGTFGNGGQNLYVSANGTLQRIFNFDINGDGYFDLPIANSHAMNEKPPLFVYDDINQEKPLELPSNGTFTATFADITGDGTDDLIVACQHNGVHSDITSVIYYGSERGLCEKYRTELLVPNARMVAVADFKGEGKKAIAFSCNKKVRIFYPTALGIEPTEYIDLDVNALSFAAGDLDGDGYDDLYVLIGGTGELVVYWGGEDGINPERKTSLGRSDIPDDVRSTSTTAGRTMFRWFPWMTSIIKIPGKTMIFRSDGDDAVFESFSKDRQPKEELRIFCTHQNLEKDLDVDAVFMGNGAVHACTGDLKNCGDTDIIIAVATEFEAIEDVLVLWESEGYALEKATRIPVPCARNVSVGPIGSDPKNYLYIALGCEADNLEIPARVYSFDKDGNASFVRDFPAMEATSVISGKTYTDGRHQVVVVNHEGERHLGCEKIAFFLGGEDGFNPDRKIMLPSCAAVDCIPVDLNDDGQPEIIVANCSENAPQLDPGAAVYWGKDGEFDPQRVNFFNSRTSHGCALGDFRKSGYIDLIFTGLSNRKLSYFKGGPDGYDFENPEYILLGPEKDQIEWWRVRGKAYELATRDPEEVKRCREFGGPRWIFAADLNNDGWLDLIVPQITGPRAMILWGGPDGFSEDNMQVLAVDAAAMANAADLDGDGYIDLIFASHMTLGHTYPQEKGKMVIYWGGPNGFSENRKSFLPSYCANSLTVQDFNNDGRLDLYCTAYSNGRLRDIDSRIYFQGEDGMFHLDDHQLLFNNSGCGCLAGDFNGDGYIDLAVASHKKDGNHIAESFVFWGGEDGINENRYTALPSIGPHGMCTADIGNVMDRSNSEYYYSEAYKTEKSATKVSWEATNGKKTWVKIQFRCAEIADNLEKAEWSESFENGADISALNLTGYIQYKLELGAYCGIGTPRVTEITVEFE